jgi:hypothetical protein
MQLNRVLWEGSQTLDGAVTSTGALSCPILAHTGQLIKMTCLANLRQRAQAIHTRVAFLRYQR